MTPGIEHKIKLGGKEEKENSNFFEIAQKNNTSVCLHLLTVTISYREVCCWSYQQDSHEVLIFKEGCFLEDLPKPKMNIIHRPGEPQIQRKKAN